MKILREIFYFCFSWIFGGLFILGSINEFFLETMYPGQQPIAGIPYKYYVGTGGFIVGYFLIRHWFKRRKK